VLAAFGALGAIIFIHEPDVPWIVTKIWVVTVTE
jgi:hypothetical protein